MSSISRTWRAIVALACLLPAACGSGGGGSATPDTVDATGIPIAGEPPAGIEATPRFLAEVADTTESVASLRFSLDFSMTIRIGADRLEIDPDEPFATGEIAGDRERMVMDLGVIIRSMADSLGGAGDLGDLEGSDLTMEMVGDAETFYMRAPFFASLARTDPAAAAAAGPLAELGDGWGSMEVSRLGDLFPSDVLDGLGGGQTADPMQVNALLRSIGEDVTEVGRARIGSVDVTHMSGTVTMGDLIEAQGLTVEQMLDAVGTGTVDAVLARQTMGAMFDTPMPIDVYVDDEGLLRRVAYSLDLGPMLAELSAALGEPAPGGLVFRMHMVMDYFDYGDPGIVVELPEGEPVVDITDWMVEMAGLGGFATPS